MAIGWTQRVREAWQWVKAGVSLALGREPAFEQYTAGGGVVEEAEWENAWTLGERLYQQGVRIGQLQPDAVIVPEYFTVVDIDYAGEFHLSAEIYYFDKVTQDWEHKYVSTNLGEAATKQDWEAALIQAMKDTEESPQIDETKGYNFRGWLAERR